jgi:uncharacterized PurR-regulated membrane protein YhhQ (DUF165 family)
MWNNLLKLTLVSYIWKRHKRTLIALPILLIYFWVINLIHHDVIAFATLKENTQWLGWSFLIKWIFILLGVFAFVFIHLNVKNQPSSKPNPTVTDSSNTSDIAPEDDPFHNIRHKKKLRSKAEVILNDNKDE